MISALRRFAARVVHALRPHHADAETSRELRAHLTLIEDELIGRGLTPDEARREARRTLGGLAQAAERHRDARGFVWIQDFRRDVVYAWRMLWRAPGFTLIAVVSIAFGTGANVAMFSAADALLLRPLPVDRPDELLTVGSKTQLALASRLFMSYPDYVDLAARARTFEGLTAYRLQPMALATGPAESPRVRVVTMVTTNFLDVLGVRPVFGRAFSIGDAAPGRGHVAVITYGMWQADFGADPAIVGRTIRISGTPFTVIGVTPEQFTGVEIRYVRNSIFVPLATWPSFAGNAGGDPLTDRALRMLTVKGRLKPTATRGDAVAEVAGIGVDLQRAFPGTNADQNVTAETELQVRYEQAPLDVSLVLVVSVLSAAVLAVACANVAGLLASRAPVRAREIAMRLAIGAGRGRLLRQLLTESLMTAMAGAAGGLAVGRLAVKAMTQIQYPTDVFAIPEIRLDSRALVFSILLAVASAILFGLWPALQATRVDLAGALKSSDGRRTGRVRLPGRNTLVAAQVALSLVLVTISAFALDVFSRGLADGPGFRTERMAKFSVDLSQARLDGRGALQYIDRVLDAARSLPSVESAAAMSFVQLFGFRPLPVAPADVELPRGQEWVRTFSYDVDDSYFQTMAIPVVAGRAFSKTDDMDAPRVVIVNEHFARHYWPGGNAVGKRVRLSPEFAFDESTPRLGGDDPDRPAAVIVAEIVGVVRTSKVAYFTEPPTDAIYYPLRQSWPASVTVAVATTATSAALLQPLKDAVTGINADVIVYDVQTMEAFYDSRVTRIGDVVLTMIGGMAIMGLILTTIGLYGLVSYSVSRRTREMGIRIAIGATPPRVIRMVLRQGMAPAWWGIGAGLVLAVATAQLLLSVVFPLEQGFRPVRLLEAVPLLAAVTVLAAFVPARRASRISPTDALRSD